SRVNDPPQAALTTGRKARDELRSATLRMVLTAVKTEEVAGKTARELDDAEIVTVLGRAAKKRAEAAQGVRGGGPGAGGRRGGGAPTGTGRTGPSVSGPRAR